jgi:hypothetical protein
MDSIKNEDLASDELSLERARRTGGRGTRSTSGLEDREHA